MTLLAVAGIALTLALGQWQIGRAQYKEGLQARYDEQMRQPAVKLSGQPMAQDDVLLRRVEVRGEFVPKFTVFVDNRIYKHQPGFHVATPLRIAGSERYVLVNRGWVAGPRDRSLPVVSAPAGEQVFAGKARFSLRHSNSLPKAWPASSAARPRPRLFITQRNDG